ncbi:MAG: transporter substrate-binding domain-containing protein [Halopseudomonas aestusnigri]
MRFSLYALVFMFLVPFEATANSISLKAAVPLEKPWGFYDDKRQLRGLAVTYFKALSIELGKPISIHAVPTKRLVHGVEMGRYDLSLMFIDQVREGSATIVASTLRLDKVLVGLRGMKIKSGNSIVGLRLASVRGASSGSWIDKSDTVKKIPTANYSEALWLLRERRVDAITGSYPVLKTLLQKHEMTWEALNKPYLLSCRFVMLMFSNFSAQYSQLEPVRNAAIRYKKSPDWKVLLNEVSEMAPSMLGTHIHEELLSH